MTAGEYRNLTSLPVGGSNNGISILGGDFDENAGIVCGSSIDFRLGTIGCDFMGRDRSKVLVYGGRGLVRLLFAGRIRQHQHHPARSLELATREGVFDRLSFKGG